MTGKVVFSHNSGWIWLNISRITSVLHHLYPNLLPKPMLSVVGTCWRAKGLKGAMARLREAALDGSYLGRE